MIWMIYCLIIISIPKIGDFHAQFKPTQFNSLNNSFKQFILNYRYYALKCYKTGDGFDKKKNLFYILLSFLNSNQKRSFDTSTIIFRSLMCIFFYLNLIQLVVHLVKYILSCITLSSIWIPYEYLNIVTSATCEHTSLHRLNHYKTVDRRCYKTMCL